MFDGCTVYWIDQSIENELFCLLRSVAFCIVMLKNAAERKNFSIKDTICSTRRRTYLTTIETLEYQNADLPHATKNICYH